MFICQFSRDPRGVRVYAPVATCTFHRWSSPSRNLSTCSLYIDLSKDFCGGSLLAAQRTRASRGASNSSNIFELFAHRERVYEQKARAWRVFLRLQLILARLAPNPTPRFENVVRHAHPRRFFSRARSRARAYPPARPRTNRSARRAACCPQPPRKWESDRPGDPSRPSVQVLPARTRPMPGRCLGLLDERSSKTSSFGCGSLGIMSNSMTCETT